MKQGSEMPNDGVDHIEWEASRGRHQRVEMEYEKSMLDLLEAMTRMHLKMEAGMIRWAHWELVGVKRDHSRYCHLQPFQAFEGDVQLGFLKPF